jgi:hypothetical protein
MYVGSLKKQRTKIDPYPMLFMHHPSEDLRMDMSRLERLDEQTREAFEDAMMT